MKWLMLFLISAACFPTWAAPLAVQQRVAAAYDSGELELAEIAKSRLRADVLARVEQLEDVPDNILDYWRADLTDGGPSLSVIFLEHQWPDGSGVLEAYEMNGQFLVGAHFDEHTPLTWEFKP